MDIIANHGFTLLLITCAFGFYMAWGIGANDVANAMGTSVGAKALTLKQAIVIAIVFEFLGAFLAGGEVTATIRKGIIDPAEFASTPELLLFGMTAALLAAATWLLIASFRGWPVSTTHSIVGAIVGFSCVALTPSAVNWPQVGSIVASWLVSPLLAGTMAFLLYHSVRILILDSENPKAQALRFIPLYMWLVGFMISMVTLLKGLKHVGLNIDLNTGSAFLNSAILSSGIGLVVAVVGARLLKGRIADPQQDNLEGVFGLLMIFTACSMAFAHGSNDVANAVGPLAAVVQLIQSGGDIAAASAMPWWVLLIGASGIVVGLATLGWRVIQTVGTKICHLTPSRGFTAELAAAGTVVVASGTGLPISTTHTLVGAILGVGIAQGVESVNLRTVGSIITSWLVTLPIAAGLAVAFFYGLKLVFS